MGKEFENLEQLRAKHAFKAAESGVFGGANGGEVAKKLPPMIRENGFLGALAFAIEASEKSNNSGYRDVFEAIRKHLCDIGKTDAKNVDELQTKLLESESVQLRDVTMESMLYMNYLRRFAKKGE